MLMFPDGLKKVANCSPTLLCMLLANALRKVSFSYLLQVKGKNEKIKSLDFSDPVHKP